MRLLTEGDKGQAICMACGKLRDTTYRYDTYEVPEKPGRRVENVLLAFCDSCGTLVAIPAQSSPKIQVEIRKHDLPVEARVQPSLEDVLYAVSSNIRVEPQLTMRMLINFFLQEWEGKATRDPVHKAMKSPLAQRLLTGKASSRVSSKVDAPMLQAINAAQAKLKASRTELIKAVLIEAGQNLVVHHESAKAKRFYKMASLLGPVSVGVKRRMHAII